MKTNKIILTGIALGVLCLASCEKSDYPDRHYATEGLPTVQYVRYADQDILITQGYMDEIVCLVGENMKSINKVFFNDRQAILNTSYLTANTLIVAIPSEQAVEKTDKIYLYNKAGECATFDFKVLPPSPKLSSMSFEYAAEGETVSLTGKYFMDVQSVSFTGAEAKEYTVVSVEQIDVKVPEGAQVGPVTVTTESGSITSKFYYKDNRGMLFTFEDGTLQPQGWNSTGVVSNPSDGVSGNYLQFGGGDGKSLPADGSAWTEGDGGYSMPYWPGSWSEPQDYTGAPRLTDIVDFTNYSSMAFKFEMNIPADTPWSSNAMQIIPASTKYVTLASACTDIYGVEVAAANNTYFHPADDGSYDYSLPRAWYAPWQSTGSFTTEGKWITVTIPISEFTYNWDGTPATGQLDATSFESLLIFFHGGEGTECAPIVKIDNIRVVAN